MLQLKELGVETKDASMCWVHLINYNNSLNTSIDEHILSFNKPELYLAIGVHSKIDYQGAKEFIKDITPAFTLQDMFELMPDSIDHEFYDFYLFVIKKEPGYIIKYSCGSNLAIQFHRESILDAAFDMLAWLAKRGYLKGGEK